MKKLLIAVVLLVWSELVFAIDGNTLHELFNTPAPYNDAASAYVAGIVDYDKTAYLIEVGSVGNGKFRMAHICWPQGATTAQFADVVKKYLNDHPEKRNGYGDAVVMAAAKDVGWWCKNNPY